MKVGEIRYFQWGDEKPGNVSIWTITENRSVKMLGEMEQMEAICQKLIYECPYS